MKPSRQQIFKSSAEAKETWLRENNITTVLDPNSLKDFLGQQEKPWVNNPVYFKQVKMSNMVLLKLLMDATSHECVTVPDIIRLLDKGFREVVGLLMGRIFGNVIIVLGAVELPIEDTETCVDLHSRLLHYFETQKKLGGLENVVGWYRTSINGTLVNASDVATQMRIQELVEPSFAAVIDSLLAINICQVHIIIHAFRTYPESYKPPILTSRKNLTADAAEIAELTKHLEKCYPLLITPFKFSLTDHVFQELWESYWARLVSMRKNSARKTIEGTIDNEEGLAKFTVYVKPEFTKQYSSANDNAVIGLFARWVEDAGSSKSMIRGHTSAGFWVILTYEQAEKLADNEYVQEIRLGYTCYFDPDP